MGQTVLSGLSGKFEDTNELKTIEYEFDIESCQFLCFSLNVSTNGLEWIGDLNLETYQECNFGNDCLGNPFESLEGDCYQCWDFLNARLYIGETLAYQNLLGDDPSDALEELWSININMDDYPDATSGKVVISGQTWASNENLSFDNLTLSCIKDNDGDGFYAGEDCDDNDPNVNPDSQEICDNLDNNCNGEIDEGLSQTYYADTDGDGYGDPAITIESCTGQVGYTLNNTDCDDTNAGVNPGAIEIPNNGIDENCDGSDTGQDVDNDGDGFLASNDCDDNNPSINPGAQEICDNLDNNCNGQIDEGLSQSYYADTDGDGYGDPAVSIESCTGQVGYTLNNTDCDDTNAGVNPGAVEIPNNSIDENCDGMDTIQEADNDGDGFPANNDCDDNNPDINPGATEICDGVDNNCDGIADEGLVFETYYTDGDMDGYGVGTGFSDCVQPPDTSTQGGDCDDENPDVNPGATEIPNNTIEENCDGVTLIIDLDGDGWNSDVDCDDTNAAINPAAVEVGGNGIDEDCDGVDGPSNLHEIDSFTIELYPNPVSDLLYIKTDHQNLDYKLYSLEGRLIIYGSVESEIDMKELKNGIYLLKVSSDDSSQSLVQKLVKM